MIEARARRKDWEEAKRRERWREGWREGGERGGGNLVDFVVNSDEGKWW